MKKDYSIQTMNEDLHSLIAKGEKALANGETLVALVHFETADRLRQVPAVQSALAYCLAKERQHYQKALALCREALGAEPAEARHYYQLGRIHLLMKQKSSALAAFRRGLKQQRYQPIIDELRRLGVRKPPVFTSLPRDHILNKSLGRLLTRVGSR
ncbi:MAG: tetratricopeptide repeat protein [Desulfuromonadales bacterium]|nr:tetratricopeptide repeat protein [Desulfuromonadales bacterium]